MASHGYDTAVGMSPEACTKRVHIFSIAAQYFFNQEEINSYVTVSLIAIRSNWAGLRKLLQSFHWVKTHVLFFRCFSIEGAVPSRKVRALMMRLDEGKTILDR